MFFAPECFSALCGDAKHDKSAGTITINKERRFDGIYPGLGMYAQYYVYGKKFMIDQEGEYAFEEGKLYIKWSGSSLPNTLEFSIYDVAMIVSGSEYVKIHNIHFTHYEQYGIYESAGWSNRDYDSNNNMIMSKCSFEYDTTGISVSHGTTNAASMAYNWCIDCCDFTNTDGSAIKLYSNANVNFPNVGVVNFWITNNNFYNIGFNSESNVGILFGYVKNVYFLNNTVRFVSHNGVYSFLILLPRMERYQQKTF